MASASADRQLVDRVFSPGRTNPAPSLVKPARAHASRIRTAGGAVVAAVNRQGGQVSVVAVVSDGWPEPATATCRFRLLEPQAETVIRARFIPGLRLTNDPVEVPLPHRARGCDDLAACA